MANLNGLFQTSKNFYIKIDEELKIYYKSKRVVEFDVRYLANK